MKRFLFFAFATWLVIASVDARALAQDAPAPSPDYGTHPDDGIMIAGGLTFLAGYLTASLTILSVHVGYCDDPSTEPYVSCGSTAYGFIPIVHILAGGWDGLIGGSIGLFIETIGLLIFIGGAAHHHPNPPPRTPGSVAFTARVPGADVGFGFDLAW